MISLFSYTANLQETDIQRTLTRRVFFFFFYIKRCCYIVLVLVSSHYVCNIQLISRLHVQVASTTGPLTFGPLSFLGSLFFLRHLASARAKNSTRGRGCSAAGLLTLVRADHHLGDEVDNSARRLLGVVLGKQVTNIVRGSASFPRHKAEDPAKRWRKAFNGEAATRPKQATSLKITALMPLWWNDNDSLLTLLRGSHHFSTCGERIMMSIVCYTQLFIAFWGIASFY